MVRKMRSFRERVAAYEPYFVATPRPLLGKRQRRFGLRESTSRLIRTEPSKTPLVMVSGSASLRLLPMHVRSARDYVTLWRTAPSGSGEWSAE